MLVQRSGSVLLLIDLQERLVPAIHEAATCIANGALLLAGARRLAIPVLATEQYPAGIGPIVAGLRDHLENDEIFAKLHFDGSAEAGLLQAIRGSGRPTVVIGGMEAHVCVLQTTLGLKARGFRPVLVADAVASRSPASRDLAIARMRASGIEIVSTEMVLFEWLGVAGTRAFRDLLPLIKAGKAGDGPP